VRVSLPPIAGNEIAEHEQTAPPSIARWFRSRPWFLLLSAVALIYALLAGLRTVSDFDIFWQMATGRWVVQHHTVFSTDVFSYTASGQPWIYPAGSGLLFYLAYLVGGYGLISWLGAIACVGTIALLRRRGSAVTAALAVIAVPAIAARTSPRAEMFTVIIFAAYVSILWEQYETGAAKLWLLPLLMTAWVNLHLGFIAGVALVCAYTALEVIRLCDPSQRKTAGRVLKAALPWLTATLFATLVNPWGWGIYRALFRQEAAMAVHAERITEWAGISFTSTTLEQALSIHDPASSGEWLLLFAAVAAAIAALHRRWPAALLLAGVVWMTIRHVRFFALLACVVVVVGSAILAPALNTAQSWIRDKRLASILAGGVGAALILLVGLRAADLVGNRYYFNGSELTSFGAGLSWWFPERAMAFIERENLPAQVFNGYEAGGFVVWRLGTKYRDYIDGRAIPFGPDLFNHLQQVLQSPPDSPAWQNEADRYGINTVVLSLARYEGLKFVGAVLPQYCTSENWRPVYLDEVSAVFVRRRPETQALIERFPVECSTAPLPTAAHPRNWGDEFNRWANAAAVLLTLQRNQEAAAASAKALSIFSDSAPVWYIRGSALWLTGHPREAEQSLLQSVALQVNVSTWTELADLYRSQRRYPAAIDALERLAVISPDPSQVLALLGYTELDAGRPRDALQAFDRAERAHPVASGDAPLAELNHGRALAWSMLGDLNRATSFEEKAVSLAPLTPDYWNQLGRFYTLQGRAADAARASERAVTLTSRPEL